MVLKYNMEIDAAAICTNIKRLIGQVYKLLPNREENVDWQTPLTTIIEELSGMSRLLIGQQENLFSLLCKLEGLYTLDKEEDFFSYRRTIFECLNLLSIIKGEIEICQD
jgi:hypothetical protein